MSTSSNLFACSVPLKSGIDWWYTFTTTSNLYQLKFKSSCLYDRTIAISFLVAWMGVSWYCEPLETESEIMYLLVTSSCSWGTELIYTLKCNLIFWQAVVWNQELQANGIYNWHSHWVSSTLNWWSGKPLTYNINRNDQFELLLKRNSLLGSSLS